MARSIAAVRLSTLRILGRQPLQLPILVTAYCYVLELVRKEQLSRIHLHLLLLDAVDAVQLALIGARAFWPHWDSPATVAVYNAGLPADAACLQADKW